MGIFDILFILPALMLLVTAVARVNDLLSRDRKIKKWWVRRVGLLMVAVSMVMLIASYFTVEGTGWVAVMRLTGLWGFALTWLTTPNMIPWWKWITKYEPEE